MAVKLFGSAENTGAPNNNNPDGIKVSSGNINITYKQILNWTIANSLDIAYCRLINTAAPEQLKKAWIITSSNLEGQTISCPVPSNDCVNHNPVPNQDGILDIIYPFHIDLLTEISFSVLPRSVTTIYFYPQYKSENKKISLFAKIRNKICGLFKTKNLIQNAYKSPTVFSVKK